jgi:hypothetical protein
MELSNRDKLEVKMRRAVLKVFKQHSTGGSRMPPWGQFKADLVEAIEPVIERIQLDAIRNMFAKFGDGPAPPQAKPEAWERAAQLADDLVSVSIKRWKALGRKRSPEQVADWWALNFGKVRATNIGVTETTIAHQTGEDIAWRWLKRQGVKLEGTWIAEKDACKFCRRMHMKKARYWRRFYPAGPPSPHVNCRCHIHHEESA